MSAARAKALAHDRALADWLEAVALVASVRRSAVAAAEQAAERARAAAMLARARRIDAFAVGVSDAAQVLGRRAVVEERRLEEAIRAETLLRAKVSAARCHLATALASVGAADALETPCE